MATKKPATKKVAKKAPAKKTATKKPAVKKTTTAKNTCLFQVTGNGDDVNLKVQGNGKLLLEALASALHSDPEMKTLVQMAVMIA